MSEPHKQLPAFSLDDLSGTAHTFPAGRTTMLCFVKEDCPTCQIAMPVIEAFHRAFGSAVSVLAIGQEAAGNRVLAQRHSLTCPMLDDSALRASFAYGFDTVPMVFLADAAGTEVQSFAGFVRSDWQALASKLAHETGLPEPPIDWASLPEWRAGCGSKAVEPGISERLEAEARGDRMQARRIELGEGEDL